MALQARNLGGDNFVFEDTEEDQPVWAYEEQLRAKQRQGLPLASCMPTTKPQPEHQLVTKEYGSQLAACRGCA